MSVLSRTEVEVVHEDTSAPAPGRGRSAARSCVAGAALLIAVVHLVNLGGWPIFIDDEGTYTAQAWAVLHGQLAHYQYWYDHPPAGWMQVALLMGWPSYVGLEPTVESARYVMVAYTVATALLLYRLTRNLGGRTATSISAMLVWGLSPLVIAQGRQVLLDNLTLPWVLGALVLATGQRKALWQHVGAGLCLGVAVLTKETTLVLAPALLVALWTSCYRPTRAFSIVGATVMGGLVVGVYPLFALLKSEVLAGDGHVSIQDAVAFQLLDRPGSGTVLDADSDVRKLMDGWFYYEHVVLLAGAAMAALCVFDRRWRCIGVATLTMIAMLVRPGGYVPSMYIIGIVPFTAIGLALISQGLGNRLTRIDRPRRPVGTVIGAVLLASSVVLVAPHWIARTHDALTDDLNADRTSAIDWMDTHLDRKSRILVDDSYWNDLVAAGWSGDGWSGPIWYFKLDLDPVARETNLPGGWREVDYIVVSRTMADAVRVADAPPQLMAAYDNSTPVQSWGTGADAVELRRVTPPDAAEAADATGGPS